MQLKWITALSLSSVMAVACGGGGPDTAKVKADFDSPSGKTSDKDAVIAANSKRSAGGGATNAAGTLLPIGSFGLASRHMSEGPFSRVSAVYLHDLVLRGLRRPGAVGARIQAQFEEGTDFSACIDPSSGSASASGNSASYSFSIDLAECGSGMTGSLDMSGEFEHDGSFTNGTASFEVSYNNVCVTATGDCVSGVIALEMTLSEEAESLMVMAWDLTSSGGDLGEIATRGGIRFSSSADGEDSIEFLAYVQTAEGEYSYVFKILSDGEGNVTLEIRGSDGSLQCQFNADGSGSCTGDNSFDWAAGEADEIASDPLYAGYDG